MHSVHPNGWADGTLLGSGARGWLPTNYCEPYDHPIIRNLLNALTHLWDLVRDGESGNLSAFAKQDYVRGMIAGIRFFLVRLNQLDDVYLDNILHVAGKDRLSFERLTSDRGTRWSTAHAKRAPR